MDKIVKIVFVLMLTLLIGGCHKERTPIGSVRSEISLRLQGSHNEWENTLFTGHYQPFTTLNHSQFKRHIDGGFSYSTQRSLTAEDDEAMNISLYIYVENEVNPIEIGRVYSLKMLTNSRASIRVTTPQSDNSYYATDGYIIFDDMTLDQSDYLLSGEFYFNAVSTYGDKIEVCEGRFDNSRTIVYQK